MSGKDEQPQTMSAFPTCKRCGNKVWDQRRSRVERLFISEEGEGLIYRWENPSEYTGEDTFWSCYNCGNRASDEQMELIEEFYEEAEWI